MGKIPPEKRICNEERKKFCFHEKKENMLCSLNEVEHFLCNFKKVVKSIEIYKLLKW